MIKTHSSLSCFSSNSSCSYPNFPHTKDSFKPQRNRETEIWIFLKRYKSAKIQNRWAEKMIITLIIIFFTRSSIQVAWSNAFYSFLACRSVWLNFFGPFSIINIQPITVDNQYFSDYVSLSIVYQFF